ncbi:uncharacterized protein LOC106642522 [Copidosoma floridanum]|uniref:uncharacterized protein LOC106642522 n=1 Tax=Copidosoma floridanum TaxID=29053 RepID=UPI0006C9974D|nr:uncharacterized protein LOC106642522 [Copidosoma floridanum]
MKLLLFCCVCFGGLVALARAHQSLDECLEKDSISCVQKSLYARAKQFFDQKSFELVSGVSLVKTSQGSARAGKALAYEQEIEESKDVTMRQNALENFVGEGVSEFLTGRSLQVNFTPAFEKITESARAFSESIPSEVRQAANEVVEGRGKKKVIKAILPLLIAAKVKLGLLATLAYFGIALVAKKAILASIISIAVSAFLSLRSLWLKSSSHDTTAYNAGWSSGGLVSSGWSAPIASSGWASSGWDDAHGAFSAPSQAFSGYHRR